MGGLLPEEDLQGVHLEPEQNDAEHPPTPPEGVGRQGGDPDQPPPPSPTPKRFRRGRGGGGSVLDPFLLERAIFFIPD